MAQFTFAPSAKTVPNGTGRAVEYEFSNDNLTGVLKVIGLPQIPHESIIYLLTYGLKQSLADSYASAKTQAEFDAMLAKRLDKLADGSMTFREGGTVDPFESECIRITKAKLDAWAAKKGRKLPKRDSDEYRAMLAKARDAWAADVEKEAKRRMAEAAKLDVSDDLDFDMPGDESAPTE